MNKKVGNTISSRILSAIGVLFLVFMALFAAIPLLQVLFNSFKTNMECKT